MRAPLVPVRLCLRQFRRPDLGPRWLAKHAGIGWRPARPRQGPAFEVVGRLAHDVMGEIARLVPVLPVSLIATVLLEADGRSTSSSSRCARPT